MIANFAEIPEGSLPMPDARVRFAFHPPTAAIPLEPLFHLWSSCIPLSFCFPIFMTYFSVIHIWVRSVLSSVLLDGLISEPGELAAFNSSFPRSGSCAYLPARQARTRVNPPHFSRDRSTDATGLHSTIRLSFS